ncbi:hypothetical protein ACQR0V_05320 [Bradyrhizobium sp. HKCCYLS2058]|uniref:hypothetical protein n=1 Tax=Bradyrhizobium TaxID=374 RepID=UPI0028E9D1A2|nr:MULTISPECIES: hypothetical protein [unclassified Bradyrhizobium]
MIIVRNDAVLRNRPALDQVSRYRCRIASKQELQTVRRAKGDHCRHPHWQAPQLPTTLIIVRIYRR